MHLWEIDAEQAEFRADLKQASRKHPSVGEDLREVLKALEKDPSIGDWIPGLRCEVRKVRLGVKKARIGKHGGYRLIYLVDREPRVITLLFFHYKPTIELIPTTEIAKLVKRLQTEGSGPPRQTID